MSVYIYISRSMNGIQEGVPVYIYISRSMNELQERVPLHVRVYLYIVGVRRDSRKVCPYMFVYIYISRSMNGLQEGVPQHVREWINHWADICEPQVHNTKIKHLATIKSSC